MNMAVTTRHFSYSPPALNAFRRWLADRYGSVQALNEAWGNVFWSMEYSSFDQIDLPNLTVTEPNPAHVLAFRRFSSDQVVAFNKAQVDVLRDLTDAPLLHNYMGRVLEFDHFKVGGIWISPHGTAIRSGSCRTGLRRMRSTKPHSCNRATRICRPFTMTSIALLGGVAGG